MRICVIGDLHWRSDLPYSSMFEDGRRAEWDRMIEFIVEYSQSCDMVVLLGDNLNSRNNTSLVLREFVGFLKKLKTPACILVGNHERTGNVTALDFLEKLDIPGIKVYTSIENLNLDGVKMSFLPFLTPALVGAESNEEGVKKVLEQLEDGDILFAHHAVTGATTGTGMSVDFFNEIVLPAKEVRKRYTQTFAGHIHNPSEQKGIVMTGNSFTSEVGEHERFVYSYDTETKTVDKAKLPIKGIYKVVFDGKNKKKDIPKDAIVKCVVNNKDVSVEKARSFVEGYASGMIVEDYRDERQKVHFEDGALDLSIDNLLKIYAESRNVDYNVLREGYELIRK